VVRSAPWGLLPPCQASRCAGSSTRPPPLRAHTHGHLTGQLASGALAVVIGALVRDANLDAALDAALEELTRHDGTWKRRGAVVAARQKAASHKASFTTRQVPGVAAGSPTRNWRSLYTPRSATPHLDEFRNALSLAVTHSGDSDSTGAIAATSSGLCTARRRCWPTSLSRSRAPARSPNLPTTSYSSSAIDHNCTANTNPSNAGLTATPAGEEAPPSRDHKESDRTESARQAIADLHACAGRATWAGWRAAGNR
jgi:hypothetical protein